MNIQSQSDQSLKVLTFGAGAIGAYIGGSLALHGNQVVFLDRPEVASMLSERGLRLLVDNQEQAIPDLIMATSIPEALLFGPYDVAIFALKAYDTASILPDLAAHQQHLPAFLCLQNGVDNEAALSTALGIEKIIPGTVTSAIGKQGVEVIILERLRGMGVSAKHHISNRLLDSLNRAGLNARLYPNPNDMKWSKMLTNLVGNATSAILNMTPAEIFSNPWLFQVEMQQLCETLTVMDALGVEVVNLPGTPVQMLAFAARYLPAWASQPILKRAIGGGRGSKMPSFYLDLYNGRGKSEVIYLNGAVVDHGSLLGIKTPINKFLTETLMALTKGELNLDAYQRNPDKFLKALRANRL